MSVMTYGGVKKMVVWVEWKGSRSTRVCHCRQWAMSFRV